MNTFAYVGIRKEVVSRLIMEGHLCAADLRSLDADTKQYLWQTCLWACQHKLKCRRCPSPCQHSTHSSPLTIAAKPHVSGSEKDEHAQQSLEVREKITGEKSRR